MTILQALILGIVQGATEFLPISSSGHLVVLPWLFNFPDPGLTFDVALHFGTLIAIVLFFFSDWIRLFSSSFRFLFQKSQEVQDRVNARLLGFLVIASVPGAVLGMILEKLAESKLRSPLLVAADMTVLGVLLWIADSRSKNGKKLEDLTLVDSLLIGFSQALALFPGVSRSGITITTSLFRGVSRVTAARFSFLLATPITFGACLLKSKDFFAEPITAQSLVGIAASALVGFLTIKYLLRFVATQSYKVFTIYRLVFAAVVVVVYFVR